MMDATVIESLEEAVCCILGSDPVVRSLAPAHGVAAYEAQVFAHLVLSGEHCIRLTLGVPEHAGQEIVRLVFGMEVDFHSADMEDAAGELLNMLAGGVLEGLEARSVAVEMGLPTVTRELPQHATPAGWWTSVSCSTGTFLLWIAGHRLEAACSR
jgi:hypothetical protein